MDLKKAKGEDLRRIREVMGNGLALCDGTPIGIECAVQASVPWVHHLEWVPMGPGATIALVKMRWWAWLTLGVLHFVGLGHARVIIDQVKPAGTMVLVALW